MVVAGKTSRDYQPAENVFAQGEIANAVFYLDSGKVKLTVVSSSGKEAVISILPKASFFGEGCLAGQPLRMSTASAVELCNIIRVERSVMLGLLHQQPRFAEEFLAYLLSRNIRMEADLMANFGQESKPISLIAKINQETLAEMIGTTRSRVSFFLNRFRDLGFIDYNADGMHINSSLVSVVLHD
jgi:CRP-like cAMP-binding protein